MANQSTLLVTLYRCIRIDMTSCIKIEKTLVVYSFSGTCTGTRDVLVFYSLKWPKSQHRLDICLFIDKGYSSQNDIFSLFTENEHKTVHKLHFT